MTLTIEECLDHVTHAIGGQLIGIDTRRVLDEAGRNLLNLRPWEFMKRPPVTLGFTATQSFIVLPTDFSSIVTLEYTQGLSARVNQTTLTQIAQYRSLLSVMPGYLLYVSPVWNPDTNGVPQPRLEIFPTPQSTDATALTMIYRPRWIDSATSDQTYIPIPDWMESVFLQLVRATATGYQMNNMDAALAPIVQGVIWAAAVKQDEISKYIHGEVRGGALQAAMDGQDGEWLLRNQALPPAAG